MRDEDEQYASRLQEAGNLAVRRYNGTIRGSFSMGAAMDQGKQAIEDVAACLSSALGSREA